MVKKIKRTGVIEDIIGLGRREEAKAADRHDERRHERQIGYDQQRKNGEIGLVEYVIKTWANK